MASFIAFLLVNVEIIKKSKKISLEKSINRFSEKSILFPALLSSELDAPILDRFQFFFGFCVFPFGLSNFGGGKWFPFEEGQSSARLQDLENS